MIVDKADGTTHYDVGIGPWPDAYQPQFNWTCTEEPRVRPGAAYQVFNWWYIRDAVLSPDGKTMKGSSTERFGVGDAMFQWELHLVK